MQEAPEAMPYDGDGRAEIATRRRLIAEARRNEERVDYRVKDTREEVEELSVLDDDSEEAA